MNGTRHTPNEAGQAGNFSPVEPPTEAHLEELYYYRFRRPEGWGFARVYTPDRSLDASFAPGDGDVLLIPRGYHPFGAPAGYDAYYLKATKVRTLIRRDFEVGSVTANTL